MKINFYTDIYTSANRQSEIYKTIVLYCKVLQESAET